MEQNTNLKKKSENRTEFETWIHGSIYSSSFQEAYFSTLMQNNRYFIFKADITS